MKFHHSCVVLAGLLAASHPLVAAPTKSGSAKSASSLVAAKRSFRNRDYVESGQRTAPDAPPARVFQAVRYPAAPGPLAAYLTPNPGDGKKHPAIVWITGGDCNSISDVWSPASPSNDQTAAAYRKAGIVMMFPSLRGGNTNPGRKEGFLGEVDDVLAATRYLEKLPYVDPKRIYLGGHSTGGTLALLVAESSARFRAVFAFGPVADVRGYGADSGFFPREAASLVAIRLRSPGYWLQSVQSPTWVFEGVEPSSNIDQLRIMANSPHSPEVRFLSVPGANHFSILAPMNDYIARAILRDTGAKTNIKFGK